MSRDPYDHLRRADRLRHLPSLEATKVYALGQAQSQSVQAVDVWTPSRHLEYTESEMKPKRWRYSPYAKSWYLNNHRSTQSQNM